MQKKSPFPRPSGRPSRYQLIMAGTLLLAIVSCAPTKGPGSTRDAVRFGKLRLSELRASKVRATDDGCFIGERLELRNDKSGCNVSGRRVFAWVKYEYRKHQTTEFLTREQAEEAISIPADSGWTNCTERYHYRDGDWVMVEADDNL